MIPQDKIDSLICAALIEDSAWDDVTSNALISKDKKVQFDVVNREEIIMCGGEIIQYV